MGQDVPDEQFLDVEMNRCDQPVLVAADVEHIELAPTCWDEIYAPEGALEFSEITEPAGFDHLEPCFYRRIGISMLLREVPERLLGNHVHDREPISI